MKYKFIDIGCGHSDVSTDIFGLNVNGLLVEPIQEYCKVLPHSNTIKIECAAVTEKNGTAIINADISENIQYVPGSVIINAKNLNRYLKKYGTILGTSSFYINNIVKNKNRIPQKVKTITLKDLFLKYDVTEIDQLKIDVEGYENIVLKQLIELMRTNKVKINKKIIFEYNNMSDMAELNKLKEQIASDFGFNYRFQSFFWNNDIIMEKL